MAEEGLKQHDYGYEDPDPLSNNATDEQQRQWIDHVNRYADAVLKLFKEQNAYGEELWFDFTSTFRETSIQSFSTENLVRWIKHLNKHGVYVQTGRGIARVRALCDCLNREDFVPTKDFQPQNNFVATEQDSPINTAIANQIIHHEVARPVADFQGQDNNNNNNNLRRENAKSSTGVMGLMRSYQGRQKFSGAFDEDLNSALELYEMMSRMCHLTPMEKVEGFPVMLRDDALNYYLSSSMPSDTYESLIERFREHYTTPEQRNRVLISWQSTRLSIEMRENTEKSELEVFRAMITTLSKLQRQLSAIYHRDQFLRDQIIISSDTPKIQQSMRERVPTCSNDATNRIATFLSSESGSAGAFAVTHDIYFTTGRRYGGDARRNLKPGMNYQKTKAISRWLAEHKGCFVCKKDHRARDHHTRKEVAAAIEALKKKYPYALITITDFANVFNDYASDPEQAHACDDEGESESDESDVEIDIANISEDCVEVFQAEEKFLANASFIHGRSFVQDQKEEIIAMYNELRMGEENKFKGIYLDTCANRSSVMSLSQYKAYCIEFHVPMNISDNENKTLKGIGGISSTIGCAWIPIPFKNLKLIVDVKFQIVKCNVPSLLCMKDMIQNGLDISIQRKEITYKKLRQPLHFENYFLIHRWEPKDVTYSFYTEVELRKLHRSFGHPSVSAMIKVLKAARPNQMTAAVRESIMNIVQNCTTCATYSSNPKRFRITVGTEDLRFNNIVAIDIMYISSKPVLHIVDEATHFSAATFLHSISSAKVWKAFLKCWSRIYLGPPDYLRIDQGSQFVSTEFLSNVEADGIEVLEAPIESPNTMSHVERYHGPLRAAYNKIRDSLPRSENDAECLQMAVKSLNDTIGLEGLCPTLLVFGSIPRPGRNIPSETQIARAEAMEKGMKAVRQEQAKRKVAFGLRISGVPKEKEFSAELRKLPAGAEVLFFRNKTMKWEGPYRFISIEGETVNVQMPTGRKIFRSTVVKPVTKSILDSSFEKKNVQVVDSETVEEESREKYTEAFPTVLSNSDVKNNFTESREKELSGLLSRGIFKVVDRSSVPKGTRIFGTRWVDALKTVDGKTFEKSRLVAQNFRDKGATIISTKSPTITRLGFRLALSLCAMSPDMEPYLRDISQAYTQSEVKLERDVYLEPVPDMGIPRDKVLLALKPLYGIPESGLHWYVSYFSHHKNILKMIPTKFDQCVFYRRNKQSIDGVTVLQVDDSFGFGTKEFLDDESATGKKYLSKERKIIEVGEKHDFNGLTIRRLEERTFEIEQVDKLQELKMPENQTEFVSERAKVQYIGISTRPDLCASSQLLATAAMNPKKEDYKKISNIIKRCKETKNIGLKFVKLDKDALRLMLFTDASFANSANLKSQLGFILVLADAL